MCYKLCVILILPDAVNRTHTRTCFTDCHQTLKFNFKYVRFDVFTAMCVMIMIISGFGAV